MRWQHLFTIGIVISALPAWPANAANFPTRLDGAEKLSRETGRPMLIVAGSAT